MTTEEAIAIVAERAIWAAIQEIDYVDYGDIDQDDWERVGAEIDERVHINMDNLALYQQAYDHLSARALES